MIKLQKKWLEAAPWESVVSLNQALCRDKQLEFSPSAKTFDVARQLWEKSSSRSMTLKEVLDVCRECNDLIPFTFNNGNTFSAIGKTLVADLIEGLGAVEAHIVRTTVGHYVAGLIEKRELLEVLRHFDKKWKLSAKAAPKSSPTPAVQAAPQVT